VASGSVKGLRLACQATVHSGDYARGGLTRGAHQASDHDLGCQEQDGPCGLVDDESAERTLTFGSSDKTSDCIVDALAARGDAVDAHEPAATSLLPITMDNGPESRGRRTPFLYRMVPLADAMNKPMQRLDSPPSHSTYKPIERGWGILELKWKGTKLIAAETRLEWAQRMTWKGRHPVVALSHKGYPKGIALGKAAMPAVEKRLERHPAWPKYDILINPAPTS